MVGTGTLSCQLLAPALLRVGRLGDSGQRGLPLSSIGLGGRRHRPARGEPCARPPGQWQGLGRQEAWQLGPCGYSFCWEGRAVWDSAGRQEGSSSRKVRLGLTHTPLQAHLLSVLRCFGCSDWSPAKASGEGLMRPALTGNGSAPCQPSPPPGELGPPVSYDCVPSLWAVLGCRPRV